MIEELSAFREQLETAFEGAALARIRQTIDYLLQTPVLALQERYSAGFDLNPSTCLNLTYHHYGDDKQRGAELARFAESYETCGFDPVRSELPDYLPMVVELLSESRDDTCWWMITQYREALAQLAERLGEAENPYSGVLQILAETAESADCKENKGA